MTIETALLDRMSALVGRRDLSQAEFSAWFGGAADGGPAGDGLFPLTDSTGYARLVPSPARQMADYADNGRFTIAAFAAVTAATEAEITAGPPTLVGLTAAGDLRRFTTNLFAARRTEDLSVLPPSEFAEWLQCLSSTGMERKIALSALTRTVGEIIDPSLPPYNVKFDFKKAKFVTATGGSNRIVADDSGVFSVADLGKLAAVSSVGPAGSLAGYIGVIEDSRTVRLFTDRTFATPANAGYSAGYQEMMWGTDSTAGLQAAFDAAEPIGGQYGLGKVVLLSGVACATALQFGSIAIVGLGSTVSGIAALPVGDALKNTPVLRDKQTGRYANFKADRYTLRDFAVFGQRFTGNYSGFRNNIEVTGGYATQFVRTAPYAVVDGVHSYEASWNGLVTNGAFAGACNNLLALQNAQIGLRMGWWDLNGQNWHSEGNGYAGVMSGMPGANINSVRSSYNGINAANSARPHENGCNWCELGTGNTVTNLRMQESWCDSLVISSVDPLNQFNSQGFKATFSFGTFDDTGDTVLQGLGGLLPGVRAMVYLTGGSVRYNNIDFIKGSGQVHQTENYATNGVWLDNYCSDNAVTLVTPGITNAATDWWAGGTRPNDTAATARGAWGSTYANAFAPRNNIVSVNGQVA